MKHPSVAALLIASVAAQDPSTPRGAPPPQPMLLPQALVLPRGDREIAIDGSLVDWPELPALRLDDRRQLSGTAAGAWRGPDDASAVAFLMWDGEALYFACSVRDEWHRALDAETLSLTEIPAADSVVLTFDPDRDTRSNGPDPGRAEDREFWLADEAGRQVVQWDRLRGTARLLDAPARVVVLHDKEQGITSYEAQIPWTEILPPGRRPSAGTCFDLQIVVNDFDESTDPMAQTRLGWTFGVGPIVDPGLLGSAMLVGDASVMQGVVPEFPPKPGLTEPPAPPPEYWVELTTRLLQHPPAVYDGTLTPAEVGSVDRLAALEEIERHCERMPRVDFLELNQRIHRRMNREVTGLMARGLPSWWRQRLMAVSKQAEDAVAAGTMRLFRLPMGGWLCRGAQKSFLVDPDGNDVAEWLWGGAQFCILTQPLDPVRRNDQLLIRMLTADPLRPVFTHIAFHLPVVVMERVPLAEPGQEYGDAPGTRVRALGKPRDDGSVAYDCSYLVLPPGGPNVLVVGPTLAPDDVAAEPQVDLLIASPRNAAIVEIANRVSPGIIVIDEAFVCQSHAKARRLTLRDLHALQRALLPHRSVLLAPGESWLVERAAPK